MLQYPKSVIKFNMILFIVYDLVGQGRPASLVIEINPVDAYGSITKNRGIVIRSNSKLDAISRILRHPKLEELSKRIDIVNPKREDTTLTGKAGA
jgi:hypothetical protein